MAYQGQRHDGRRCVVLATAWHWPPYRYAREPAPGRFEVSVATGRCPDGIPNGDGAPPLVTLRKDAGGPT